MLSYVGANFLMGVFSQQADNRATQATENLVAASGLEKDLTSLSARHLSDGQLAHG
ncbi:MAG: hypothetical protein JKP95_02080 [Oceanicaulis sp.]|nr:hypothetical protein [Oceanicaulis sp.]